jgi:hypothetical protein
VHGQNLEGADMLAKGHEQALYLQVAPTCPISWYWERIPAPAWLALLMLLKRLWQISSRDSYQLSAISFSEYYQVWVAEPEQQGFRITAFAGVKRLTPPHQMLRPPFVASSMTT